MNEDIIQSIKDKKRYLRILELKRIQILRNLTEVNNKIKDLEKYITKLADLPAKRCKYEKKL